MTFTMNKLDTNHGEYLRISGNFAGTVFLVAKNVL